MEVSINQYKEKTARSYKMILLFAMVSIAMMFAGLTSAYVVSKSRPDWLKNFQLPSAFLISTFVILASSFTFHMAKITIKKEERNKTTVFLLLTLVLGIVFVALQFLGFRQVIAQNYFFTGSESTVTTSFLYIVVLMHLVHLFGGLISILIIIYNHFKQKYNSIQTLGIELGAMFWHFLDFLWVYLFLFLYFFR